MREIPSVDSFALLSIYRSGYLAIYVEGVSTPREVVPAPGVDTRAADRALARLYNETRNIVFGAARNSGLLNAVGADAIEEALLDALHRKSFVYKPDHGKAFSSWISDLVLNAARDRLRRIRARRENSADRDGWDSVDRDRRTAVAFAAAEEGTVAAARSILGADADTFATQLLRTVTRLATEQFPSDATTLVDIARGYIIEPAMEGTKAPSRATFEERLGLSARRMRTMDERARKLIRDAATNLMPSRV